MYLALYRKYRPTTFDDVISQEHITTTLKNQIASGSVGHAYLFTGSRGTGKTTCAKIFAMAVNCLAPKDGNPCLECENCREILDGSATDIVEMDAASNNGVDDVRRLRDEVTYTPVSCKYRVYIVDEVHMLSVPAFNALLKTLEEPPPHIKFVLATTELHKVPSTIASRCQRFEFRRVNASDSIERLLWVAEKENISLDREAAALIARLSDGGMRDALSILDRCISTEDHVTPQTVRKYAGVPENGHLAAFAEMTAGHNTSGCIRLLDELHRNSKDISLIIDELLGYYRDMMLCKTVSNERDLLFALPDEQDELFRIADMYSLEDIFRCLTLLQQCADGIGKVRQRKTLAEMCFVKMCTGAGAVTERAVSVSKPTKAAANTIQFREVPPEPLNFKPKSEDQLTDAEKVNASRTRALLEETARITGAKSQTVSEEHSDTAGIPVRDEPPPPPFYDEVPPPEYPPPSENSFYDDQYPISSPEENIPDTSVRADEKNGKTSESSTVPTSITTEQWQDAISQVSFMTASLLKNSTAELEGGTLIIRSSNKMLLGNVKGDEVLRYEKELSTALGYPVHIKILPLDSDNKEDETPKTPLEKMLTKARGLGISVNIKE